MLVKRILATAASAAMVLALLPTAALADEPEPEILPDFSATIGGLPPQYAELIDPNEVATVDGSSVTFSAAPAPASAPAEWNAVRALVHEAWQVRLERVRSFDAVKTDDAYRAIKILQADEVDERRYAVVERTESWPDEKWGVYDYESRRYLTGAKFLPFDAALTAAAGAVEGPYSLAFDVGIGMGSGREGSVSSITVDVLEDGYQISDFTGRIGGNDQPALLRNPWTDDDVVVSLKDGTVEFDGGGVRPEGWHAVSVPAPGVTLPAVRSFEAETGDSAAYRAIKIDVGGTIEYAVVERSAEDEWGVYDYGEPSVGITAAQLAANGTQLLALRKQGFVPGLEKVSFDKALAEAASLVGADDYSLSFDVGIGMRTGTAGEVSSITVGLVPAGSGPQPPPPPLTEVEREVPAGGTVSTDPNGTGPTASVPVTGAVTSPTGGSVSIVVRESEAADGPASPEGIELLDVVVEIDAPEATPEEPLELAFNVHASRVPDDVVPANLLVFRNGVVVAGCTGPAGVAEPDPCVASIDVDGDGNLEIEVLTSRASVWGVAVATSACPSAAVPGDGFVDHTGAHGPRIACAAWYGLAEGFEDGTFGAGVELTRAQGAAFLARLLGEAGVALPEVFDGPFADVAGSTHARAIDQLAELGIVRGVEAGRFAPGDTLTRAQMAALLVRAYEHVGGELPAGDDAFGDDDGSVHEADIDKAAAAGFTSGVSAQTFDPGGIVTRGQMASFLTNVLDRFFVDGEVTLPR